MKSCFNCAGIIAIGIVAIIVASCAAVQMIDWDNLIEVGREAVAEETKRAEQERAEEPLIEIDRRPEAQAKRVELLRELQALSLIYKTECPAPGSFVVPQLSVTPAFLQLPFDQKEQFVGVFYAYCMMEIPDWGRQRDPVFIKLSTTNKRIGTFSPKRGLRLKQ